MQAFQDPFSVFTAQAAAAFPSNKPKFVEGTVYQLARALYEVHTAHEAQPSSAIQETLQRMSDNVDRKALLLAARSRAEALARRRLIVINSGKPQQQQLTVFEQAQLLAQQEIKKLKSEIRILNKQNKVKKAQPSTPVKKLASSKITTKVREKLLQAIALERQVEEADYNPKQIEEAIARLQRIKKMDQQTDESEDTVPQMVNIWKQLAQALLLQKLAPRQKTVPLSLTTTFLQLQRNPSQLFGDSSVVDSTGSRWETRRQYAPFLQDAEVRRATARGWLLYMCSRAETPSSVLKPQSLVRWKLTLIHSFSPFCQRSFPPRTLL